MRKSRIGQSKRIVLPGVSSRLNGPLRFPDAMRREAPPRGAGTVSFPGPEPLAAPDLAPAFRRCRRRFAILHRALTGPWGVEPNA